MAEDANEPQPSGQADNPFGPVAQGLAALFQMQRGQTLFLMYAVAFVALEDRDKPGHLRHDAAQVRDEIDGILKVFANYDLDEHEKHGADMMHANLVGLLDALMKTNPTSSKPKTMVKRIRDAVSLGLMADRARDWLPDLP